MDLQKEREAFDAYFKDKYPELHKDVFDENGDARAIVGYSFAWTAWKEAKAQAVPEGFVLVKKANRIGNPNVDFSQAPGWAKYWLKDGHSNKYWWSSTRPIKDMDLQAFCWRGDYFAEEAPSFNFAGSWDKSLTSKKAMIEAQEPTND